MGVNNGILLADYIIPARYESNISYAYRREAIKDLCIIQFFGHKKSFKDMSRDDVLSYLGSLRKHEPVDPLHKWIGTYNPRLGVFHSFFK
jgi:integrase/recombinase XerD